MFCKLHSLKSFAILVANLGTAGSTPYNDLSARKGYFFHASFEVYERVAKSVISVVERLSIIDAFYGCEKVEKTF